MSPFEYPKKGLWVLLAVTACSSKASPPAPSGSTLQGTSTDGSITDAGAGCTQERTSAAGKFSPADQAIFEASTGSVEVMITVRGGATVSMLPSCPERGTPCPAADAKMSQWMAENLQSQQCVRELIASVGGTPHEEVFWLVDDFVADLTWAQIQIVATHPDVVSIAPNVAIIGPPNMDGGPA
jgi:hypothetical protein